MSSSRYKQYTITQRQNIASGVEKELVTSVEYNFGCIPPAPGGSGILAITGVMGQEDVEREDPVNVRVLNTGQARVVFNSGIAGNTRVWADIDPGAGVAPTTEVVNVATEVVDHEVFWTGLALATRYKFYVRTVNSLGGDETSGYYYFLTGGEVSFEEGNLTVEILGAIIAMDHAQTLTTTLTNTASTASTTTEDTLAIDVATAQQAPDQTSTTVHDEVQMYTDAIII